MSEAWSATTARIAGYYRELIERYQHDPRACDYGHPASQRVKFGVLAGVMPLAGKRILDVGCGFADFVPYLAAECGEVDYCGVDITAEMIDTARRLHPGLSLRCLDVLRENPGGPFDLVTANGIFYLLGAEAPVLMRRLITRMFELSRDAVAFNSLSAWAPDPAPGEFYADPLETVAFCRTLTPWVALRHDYHPRDFTIYMYRNRRP
jgi:SAM-dependent methyltransferase